MAKVSAGLLMYRYLEGHLQVLLVHPGGPFFQKKDAGAWSIPKGEVEEGEDLLQAAEREFREELGINPLGPFQPLAPVRQRGGKIVYAWAFNGDCNPVEIQSNCVTMEWPPKSGRQIEFPEVDRAGFFDVDQAILKINSAQVSLVMELNHILSSSD